MCGWLDCKTVLLLQGFWCVPVMFPSVLAWQAPSIQFV